MILIKKATSELLLHLVLESLQGLGLRLRLLRDLPQAPSPEVGDDRPLDLRGRLTAPPALLLPEALQLRGEAARQQPRGHGDHAHGEEKRAEEHALAEEVVVDQRVVASWRRAQNMKGTEKEWEMKGGDLDLGHKRQRL